MCLYESAVSRRSARRDKHFVCNISSFNVPFCSPSSCSYCSCVRFHLPVEIPSPGEQRSLRRPLLILPTSLPAIFAGMPECLLVPECVNAHVCAWCTHTHTHLWCDFPFLRVCLFIGSQTNGRMSVLMSPFGRTGDHKTQTPIHVLLIIFSGGVPWELVGGRQFAFIVPICTSNSWQSAGLLLICSLNQHFLRFDLFGAGLDIDTWVF